MQLQHQLIYKNNKISFFKTSNFLFIILLSVNLLQVESSRTTDDDDQDRAGGAEESRNTCKEENHFLKESLPLSNYFQIRFRFRFRGKKGNAFPKYFFYVFLFVYLFPALTLFAAKSARLRIDNIRVRRNFGLTSKEVMVMPACLSFVLIH